MTWNKTIPTTGSYIVDIPDIFVPNWYAIEDILGEEHYDFTSALSGRHKPGLLAAIYTGPTCAITAIDSPVSGSLAFDETEACLRVFDSTDSWLLSSQWPSTRVLVSLSADQAIVTDTNTVIEFDIEEEDVLGEFDNSSSFSFSPCADGFFIVTSCISFIGAGGTSLTYTLYQDNSTDVNKNKIAHSTVLMDSNRRTFRTSSIVYATAGDKIYFKVAHNRGTDCTVEGGSDRTLFKVQRLS